MGKFGVLLCALCFSPTFSYFLSFFLLFLVPGLYWPITLTYLVTRGNRDLCVAELGRKNVGSFSFSLIVIPLGYKYHHGARPSGQGPRITMRKGQCIGVSLRHNGWVRTCRRCYIYSFRCARYVYKRYYVRLYKLFSLPILSLIAFLRLLLVKHMRWPQV